MTAEPRIRVMIVDDHQVVRDGVTAMLGGSDDIVVVGAAESAEEALERRAQIDVDVVLMDLSLPGMDGVTATGRLLESFPATRVIVLTGFVAETAVRAAVQAGAMGCLLKTVGVAELSEAIRGVMQGRSTFSSELLPLLVAPPRDRDPAPYLTPRERDVLDLLGHGRTNRAIASELSLSEGTVRIYVSTILAKLGAANRTEATALAIQLGLVEP